MGKRARPHSKSATHARQQNNMKREMKEMECEDAPSGFVKLYNYKEPFMEFEEGYGFQGVLLYDGKTDKIQCHFCGDWFNYLPHHLHREHNMTAKIYKEKVGLRQSSALISESARTNMLQAGLDKRKQNLIKGGKKTEQEKKKISETLKKCPLETKNQFGTCPLQLIDRLKKLAEKLGHTPESKYECNFTPILGKVFGSYSNACKRAGLEIRKPGVNVRHRAYEGRTKEEHKALLLSLIRDFQKQNGRAPSRSDFVRGLLPNEDKYASQFGSWRKAVKLALK